MIGVMEDIAEYSMSYFDTAKNTGKHAPENFYHGLVLGLIVSMRKEYRIVSNRESGEGRYDIAIYPFDKTKDAYILEFKVLNEHREKTVQETAQNALKQIRTRNYEADLLAYGIPADHIYKLGFGFLGKKVWVVSDPPEKDEKDQVRSEWDNLRFR
nr:PD-(D/E)XK nuclease domain-containing protein [Roseburia sp.]